MVKILYIRRDFPMTKITLRRIFSKHVLLKRTQFRLTQAQLAEAVGTSHGWIQKIESGKKMPGFFLAIKLAVFLEIDSPAEFPLRCGQRSSTGKSSCPEHPPRQKKSHSSFFYRRKSEKNPGYGWARMVQVILWISSF